MKVGKFVVRFVCITDMLDELSIMNRMSTSRVGVNLPPAPPVPLPPPVPPLPIVPAVPVPVVPPWPPPPSGDWEWPPQLAATNMTEKRPTPTLRGEHMARKCLARRRIRSNVPQITGGGFQ